jgi:hypothetical protein
VRTISRAPGRASRAIVCGDDSYRAADAIPPCAALAIEVNAALAELKCLTRQRRQIERHALHLVSCADALLLHKEYRYSLQPSPGPKVIFLHVIPLFVADEKGGCKGLFCHHVNTTPASRPHHAGSTLGARNPRQEWVNSSFARFSIYTLPHCSAAPLEKQLTAMRSRTSSVLSSGARCVQGYLRAVETLANASAGCACP